METSLLPKLVDRAAKSAIGTYAAYVAYGLLHPRSLRPGASSADATRWLPGDEVVREPHWRATFATVIHAPREDVWPWLVQMGYGRAGWYTWYAFDNGGVRSADRIVPELQDLAVGDVIPDGPRAAEGFGLWTVETLDRPRAMVLVSRRHPTTGREVRAGDDSGVFIDCSWAFVLEETMVGGTKLTVRVRARLEGVPQASTVARAARLFFGLGDTVMERTLLAGVKDRAERVPAQGEWVRFVSRRLRTR